MFRLSEPSYPVCRTRATRCAISLTSNNDNPGKIPALHLPTPTTLTTHSPKPCRLWTLPSVKAMETPASISIEELVRRCAASRSPEAWEEFVRRFHRLIATVILRTAARLGDASRQTVDDLIQETYLKLCADNFRILRTFEQQHPDAFTGYVKVLTANLVRDHFKSTHTQKRGAGHLEQIEEDFVPPAADDSAGSPKHIERAVLIQQITRHLDQCLAGPDQQRNRRIFWLHYRAGLSARAIADLPGIRLTPKGVESILARLTQDLRQRMAGPPVPRTEQMHHEPEGFLSA
jgi:RNA polymerase sigma-70 factor (ECF subfamily)